MQQNILKHQLRVLGQKLLVKLNVKKILYNIFFLVSSGCNTVKGTIEGTVLGVVKDVKSTYHYTTCIFTDATCGDLDLD